MLAEDWNKLTDLEKEAVKKAAQAKRALEHKIEVKQQMPSHLPEVKLDK